MLRKEYSFGFQLSFKQRQMGNSRNQVVLKYQTIPLSMRIGITVGQPML